MSGDPKSGVKNERKIQFFEEKIHAFGGTQKCPGVFELVDSGELQHRLLAEIGQKKEGRQTVQRNKGLKKERVQPQGWKRDAGWGKVAG